MMMFDLSGSLGRIRVKGANRVDFLQRMSTGDLLSMSVGEGRATVFVTPIGRMVDHAAVLTLDDSLLMLTSYADGRLLRWLRKYIFFNDDVQLSDETQTSRLFGIFGERAADFVAGLSNSATQLARYGHVSVGGGMLIGALALEGAGFYLLSDIDSINSHGVLNPLSQYHDLRIRAGYPAAPQEINEDYIPLEAGVLSAISFSKGCYVGQEIIARMESRGQLAKRLMRLESEQVMTAGEALTVDGSNAGKVTSVTSDGHAGLGYVRSAFARAGQQISAGEVIVSVVDSAGM